MRRLFPDSGHEVDLEAAYEHPDGVVRANFVASIDGAATVEGRSGGLSSQADKDLFMLLRRLADVILVGASTVRNENYGPGSRPIAVVTRSLDLDPGARFFAEPAHRPIVLTVEACDRERRRALENVADVVVAGTESVQIPLALDALRERGHGRVLCEGGPALLAEIVAAERLDEMCLTMAPLVVGGHSKRIVDGPPHDPPLDMHPVHVLEDEGFLFLRYSR